MSPARKRFAAALVALVAMVGAYLLGRSDGDELSGVAFLIGMLLVAVVGLAGWGVGYEQRRDEEYALEAQRQLIREEGERHIRPETGATLTTHALAIAVLLLGVLWCSYTFGSGAETERLGSVPAVVEAGR